MARRVGLGLKCINASLDMQHGMAFVVKWQNIAINARDLWLGIHVPNNIAPRILTSKPRKNAQPETPAAERAYMFYLPGRNTYTWIERKCLFPLSEYSPEEFELDGREHHSLYKRLYELIEEQDDLQYWIEMAKKERATKGQNGRQPFIVLPSANGNGGENSDDESELSEREQRVTPAAKRPRIDSTILFGNKKAKTESRSEPKVDGNEMVKIYIGNGVLQKIYLLTRNQIGKSSFLNGLVQGNPPFVFHPALYEMDPDEFELVRTYLSSDEDTDPDIVPIEESLEELLLDDDHILGDAQEIGRSYWLRNVNGIEDLKQLIPQLENTYKRAFSLGLEEMARSAIMKLQVAWNIYSGVGQLPLFLDFIENTMPSASPTPAYQNVHGGNASASSLSSFRERWAILFLAETMMLYLALDAQRFCNFMQKYPHLQVAVLGHRLKFCRAYHEHLSHLEKEFLKREPFKEAKFIHLQHGLTGQGVQDGEERAPGVDGQDGDSSKIDEEVALDMDVQDGQDQQNGEEDITITDVPDDENREVDAPDTDVQDGQDGEKSEESAVDMNVQDSQNQRDCDEDITITDVQDGGNGEEDAPDTLVQDDQGSQQVDDTRKMALQYISDVASKASPWSSKPVLTEEDEAFLQKVTSNSDNGPSQEPASPLGKDAQIALMDGAQDIPLPMSPTDNFEKEITEEQLETEEKKVEADSAVAGPKKKTRPWSLWIKKGSSSVNAKKDTAKGKEPTNIDADEIATKPTASDGEVITDKEQREEQEDLATILERLNLAADNNRAFSISDETQQLLQKFKLIFKDLVTGVPTAYRDLEMLLTNGDKQLKDAFGHLPGFLQKLVRQLPDKFTENLAPELLAVAGERATQSGINMENAGKAAAAAQKMGFKAPSLKELVGKPTALVGMLRSIITFLRARFPAVLGMNVLWSVALFIVLLVLWYCHKRGKEVRLENERLVTEAEIVKINEEYEQHIRPTETLSTTAPRDASIADVRSGIEQVQKAREEALMAGSNSDLDNAATTETISPAAAAVGPTSSNSTAVSPVTTNSAPVNGRRNSDKNRFSLFRTFSKRTKPSDSNIRPYPGT